MTEGLRRLTDAGVSVWLDDLNRSRLTSGGLAELIANRRVTGVTTNPTIFAAALADADSYDGQLRELAEGGADTAEAVTALTVADVTAACDLFAPVHAATGGLDGRVSLEVDPTLAEDGPATAAAARRLADLVDRPNLLVKIPATRAGLPAIEDTLAAGIAVNVTLIFSADRYIEVLDAWATGCERALDAGVPAADLVSVASFFVSRVDTAVDAALAGIGSAEARDLQGRAAVANARIAHARFREFAAGDRARALAAAGVGLQRPLWASTGVKNPAYPSTKYVAELVTPGTVNTMPETTLDAVAAAAEPMTEQVVARHAEAVADFDRLAAVGVDLGAILADLEAAGVATFIESWQTLLAAVTTGLQERR
jgi:transaldolase